MNYDAIQKYTAKRILDPQPGDHFTEMLGSVAYIEARNGKKLTVLRTRVVKNERGWDDGTLMTIDEFVKWASYGGSTPGYWLEIYPPVFPKQLLEGG